MHAVPKHLPPSTSTTISQGRAAQEDPLWVRWTLISLAVCTMVVLVVIPLVNVFYSAFSNGFASYWNSLVGDKDTVHAIKLTLFVVPITVVANVIFGVAAAWCITRFRFWGRTLLTTLIDLPFAISPVVAGLMFVLIFGERGYLGPWLRMYNIQILHAWPAIVLVTTFVTLPFVARELIPVMEAIGPDEEIAAISLGANSWQMFWRVTVPNIKWGLLYGVILCNARAMGEYGAVYVVSGRLVGKTETMPIRVSTLMDGMTSDSISSSFALASLLTMLALVTLFVKIALEHKTQEDLRQAAKVQQLE
ncbi:sulfate ABC transporter permease subunit CysW [Schlesneria paludicola]|uniref:sulfate ABC transporter permease subunit CysW n=1 Tax=Schlesneria paludicola TaxID=360056 RepID=UPI00029AB48E|nr:sulfate ABC transporter permease subunit CysW [Schlesneria paludicola]